MPFNYLAFMGELTGRPRRPYPTFDPPQLTPLRRPLAESTVALFCSAGVRRRDDAPLAVTDDLSYRLVGRDVPYADLALDHETPVRIWAEQDLNVAYPRERLEELEAAGAIARLAPNAVSMVGSITRYTPLLQETVPRIADAFTAQGVDLVWLFPF